MCKRCQKKRKNGTIGFFNFFCKNSFLYMSSRLSKICSVHTYVMIRTVYFGWICLSGTLWDIFLQLLGSIFEELLDRKGIFQIGATIYLILRKTLIFQRKSQLLKKIRHFEKPARLFYVPYHTLLDFTKCVILFGCLRLYDY